MLNSKHMPIAADVFLNTTFLR